MIEVAFIRACALVIIFEGMINDSTEIGEMMNKNIG